MWHQPSPWPVITKLCSGKHGEDILVDGEKVGEVRSETGKYGLDHQRDHGFAFPLPCEGPCRVSLAVGWPLPRPNSGQTPQKWQDRRIIPGDIDRRRKPS